MVALILPMGIVLEDHPIARLERLVRWTRWKLDQPAVGLRQSLFPVDDGAKLLLIVHGRLGHGLVHLRVDRGDEMGAVYAMGQAVPTPLVGRADVLQCCAGGEERAAP